MFSKTTILLFAATFFSILQAHSQTLQWRELQGVPFTHRYDDIYFIDENTGWTVSFNIVYKTTDGGNSWTSYTQQGINSNRSVGFFDSQIGIIGQLNYNTPMIRTTNGGVNWALVTSFPNIKPFGFCGISIVNENTAYACGTYSDSGRVYKTTNKGESWSLVFNDTSLARALVDCYFWSPDSGLAAGAYYTTNINEANSVVLFTSNSGASWQRVFKSTRTKEWCWKISFNTFHSKDFGVVSIERHRENGLSYFLKTTNRGLNWTEHPFFVYDQEGIGFVNENTGWIGGWGSAIDSTYETTNGGLNWHKVGWGKSLNRVRFINDTIAYASAQRIFKYSRQIVGVTPTNQIIPNAFNLYQNFPNPFNPMTMIKFDLASSSKNSNVVLTIYDQLGKEIRELVNKNLEPGSYQVTFDGGYYPSGIYYYKLITGDFTETRKMVILK